MFISWQMRAFLRRLLGVPELPAPTLKAVEARVSDLEIQLNRLDARLLDTAASINARITTKLRMKNAEDAPGPTNEEQPAKGTGEAPERRPGAATAHLARRFKVGG